MNEPIKGFTIYGGRYRAHVTLERADALAVAEEATARGVSLAEALRDRVRDGIKAYRRKRGAS